MTALRSKLFVCERAETGRSGGQADTLETFWQAGRGFESGREWLFSQSEFFLSLSFSPVENAVRVYTRGETHPETLLSLKNEMQAGGSGASGGGPLLCDHGSELRQDAPSWQEVPRALEMNVMNGKTRARCRRRKYTLHVYVTNLLGLDAPQDFSQPHDYSPPGLGFCWVRKSGSFLPKDETPNNHAKQQRKREAGLLTTGKFGYVGARQERRTWSFWWQRSDVDLGVGVLKNVHICNSV